MLGKLFNLTTGAGGGVALDAPTSSAPVSSLDSVQEDIHTRNLLFPDAQSLYQHRHDQVYDLSSPAALPPSTAGAFDYNGDIDLEPRDVRVVIMQDAFSSAPASLLYDSQAPPVPLHTVSADRPTTAVGLSHATTHDPRRGPTSPRKSSLGQAPRPLVIQPDSPQPRQGAFERRPSVLARTQMRLESESQGAMREYAEEIATFSGCIFGNNEFLAYKGTSTKVHVVPNEPRHDYSSSVIGDGRGSIGRSGMRSSRLAQSFSSDMASPLNPPSSSSAGSRAADRKKVLITRLFPVNIPGDDNPATTPQNRFSEDTSGYPFPQHGDDTKSKPKKAQPKQKRTPMYAVALIINLPQNTSQTVTTPASRSAFRGPSSYTEQDSFPSSFSSAKRSGWTMVGQSGGYDTFDSTYSLDIEDPIDIVTQRWDIIMRTLTHLQSVVATTLFTLLKHADMGSPEPFPASLSPHVSRKPSLSRRQSDDPAQSKPHKTNTKYVSLLPNCLADDKQIKGEVDVGRARIVSGLRATRVTTGQNRWGIWREEARQLTRWGGGKEQGFFFFNLLTGFLSVHTDWLQALSPSDYRRQYILRQKAKVEENLSIPVRTVIVGQDKMAARRLIFLLSAFLPANQQLSNVRTHRPSTSTSFGPFSQSPPSHIIPILKEESLRRKINRRAAPRQQSHSRNLSMQAPSARGSVPAHLAHLSMDHRHERRVSDAASIKTTNLPILGSDLGMRKSSAATTTTVTQETSIPHFTVVQKTMSGTSMRPGSSSSMAADDLKRTLTRGDSSGHYSNASTDSRQSSRWGSVISGIWSNRRRDSTQTTVHTRDSAGSREATSSSPRKSSAQKNGTLVKMVQEAQVVQSPEREQPEDGSSDGKPGTPKTPRQHPDEGRDTVEGVRSLLHMDRTPDPTGAFESPVKTTILDDGVIDVDVPFPDYITSFETAVSSPSSSGYLSTPGLGSALDAFEQQCRVAVDGDVPMNVAGWLQRYHPDFVLQAIPAQEDLLDQVKASLRTEPSPALPNHIEPDQARWIDVSCALVANITTFSIKLIRYRRLVKPKPPLDSRGSFGTAPMAMTPSISPYERLLDEDFIEEPIVTLDETLTDAVERVLAQSTSDASKGSSTVSSRAASNHRASFDNPRVSEDSAAPHLPLPPSEVPRSECKTVVLSALEEIARQVADKREKAARGRRTGDEDRDSILRDAVRKWLELVDAGGDSLGAVA